MRSYVLLFALISFLATAAHAGLAPVSAVGADLTDAIGNDVDADNEIDRGDTIDYEVMIESTGTVPANGVTVSIPPGRKPDAHPRFLQSPAHRNRRHRRCQPE